MRTSPDAAPAGGVVRCVRVGDDAVALRSFFEAALAEVYPYLLRRCGHDRQTAEDLTQEAFVAAVSSLKKGVVESVSIGWMLTAARSRLIDHHRAMARHDRPVQLVPTTDVDPVDTLVLGTRTVDELLARLPSTQRLVVALHHLDGLSTSEIAALTGMSVRAVESSLARARRALRSTRGGRPDV